MVNRINSFFEGSVRSVKLKKNIIASFAIKGVSIIIGFLLVRLTLDYLDQTKYGIWLTLTSFLGWFSFFEIGLGNGLKNKLSEALAVKNYELGKIYVSTTYGILTSLIAVVASVFFFVNIFIDWTVVLNTDKGLSQELANLALIVFGFFFLRFILKLIGIVLSSDQRPAMANLFGPIGNLIVLILVFVLTKVSNGSLIYLAWILSVVPVLVLSFATVYFYNGEYKNIAPSINYIKLKYAKDLMSLGVKFFAIQIAGLVIYQSSIIIIAQFFGPAEVTVYNIAFKYFSILAMVFSIIVTPFWAVYTEAWVKNDILWIKKSVRRLLMIWALMSIGGVIMLIFSNQFYYLWIGDKVMIPNELSIVVLIYFVTKTFGGIFNMFINGVGKIKLQLYLSLISAFIFVFVSIIMIKFLNLGIISVVIASIISNIEGFVVAPIQYFKIINGKAHGIWNE